MNLAILASGMTTGVGLSAPAACAAIRCGVTSVVETKFMIRGQWVMGCMVPLANPRRGVAKLVQMLVPALRECLAAASAKQAQIPLVLCLSEAERPGRLDDLDEEILNALRAELGEFHPSSAIVAKGKVSGAHALQMARNLIQNERVPCVLIAGVDSYLTAATIEAYFAKRRLLTEDNSDGFIPGEAAAAVLLGPSKGGAEMLIRGIGFAQEKSVIDGDEPLRGDGMAQAFRAACTDGGCTLDEVDYRLTDLNGEQFYFKEAALAIARTIRKVKPVFDLWHPVDCVGEIGAAIGPCVFAVALAAARKNYAPGRGVLCHFANDDGQRAAVILQDRKG
ncbi:MAG: hypothetical protein K8T89_01520 [Planctomycetes bacterium]|nr:hypothetical protein [Planctomycetota bacterium]